MPMNPAPAFELERARVALGGRRVLDDVSLLVSAGELVALLGANGAGKTTLVRALFGVLPLDGGRVVVFGRPAGHRRTLRRLGYVPQRLTAATGAPATANEVVLSGRAAIARRGLPYRAADRAATRDALGAVGLSSAGATPVAHLSGGQQRRVLIARALAVEPAALVLDEPLSGIDAESQAALHQVLADLKAGGVAVLMVEHALGALESLVDRAVVLSQGRISYEGSPSKALEGAVVEHHHVGEHQGGRGL
jgi:zinc transport system ATP-binding protein